MGNFHFKLTFLLIIFSITSASAQEYNQTLNFLKANSVWAFGNRAGLNFNGGNPMGIQTAINSGEGSAAVADPVTGNLLFYTDGAKCWNANNQIMPNGNGLLGNNWMLSVSNGTTAQGALIVPKLGSSGMYYIFSLWGMSGSGKSYPGFLFYSIVDMNLDGGLGDIVPGEKNIILTSDTLSEGMIAIPGNKNDIWLMVHDYGFPKFRAYHITTEGIDTIPVVSDVGQIKGPKAYTIANLAISPNRKMIAITASGDVSLPEERGTLLCKFDACNGQVSDPLTISPLSDYGVSFSPNNSKLYITGGITQALTGGLRQYDLSVFDSAAITNSMVPLDGGHFLFFGFNSLKLYDGKIYKSSAINGLSCINNPDLSGTACNYQVNTVVFPSGTSVRQCLPNDVVFPLLPDTISLLLDTLICSGWDEGISITADSGYNYEWSNGSSNSVLTVFTNGIYWVQYSSLGCNAKIRVDTFILRGGNLIKPQININVNELGTTLLYNTYQWFLNGNKIPGATNSTYTVTENGDYRVLVSDINGCTDTSDIYKVTNVNIQ